MEAEEYTIRRVEKHGRRLDREAVVGPTENGAGREPTPLFINLGRPDTIMHAPLTLQKHFFTGRV